MELHGSNGSAKRDSAIQREKESADELFAGPGEMHERGRALDWSSTPLGPVDEWPAALRTMVRVALDSPFPTNLWCGAALVLIYNDAYRSVLGAKHPAAFGRPGREVWEEIWPEIGPYFDSIRAGGPPVFARDAPFLMRRSHDDSREAPGEATWFTYSLSAVRDSDGVVVGFLNIVSERTEAVMAERQALAKHEDTVRALDTAESARARLADAFRQAPALMAVLRGPDHVFEFVNDAYYATVGKRELIGKPILEALPEVRGQGFVDLLDHVLRTGNPYVGHELPVRLARWPGSPPEERFITFIYHPITDPDGSISGILAHGMDVTEGVRARAEVEAARRTAVAANRLKSEFLATMSHEFRTPLNAILGYTQLLDMGVLGPATPAQHAHLARLESSARHLLQLVDDVLDVAKVDADRLEVRREVNDTEPVIAAAVELVRPQALERGVRLEAPGDATPHVSYIGDEHRVRQVLVNLLSNAVKFTARGGRVSVSYGETTEPEPGAQLGAESPGRARDPALIGVAWVFIRVTDTGPGIEPALMPQLFEPFVQGNGALTREQGGTGLGLAISRRLARLMGGDLTVRSQPGSGATFTLWLPTPARQAEAAGTRKEGPIGSVASGSSSETGAHGARSAGASVRLDDDSYLALQALGARLSGDAEAVAEHYVAAIRADGRFPGAADLPAVQIRDHATPLVGLLASQLMVIGETRDSDPTLLRDGAQAQRLIAELHGAQRLRIGWREEDIEREVQYLIAAVERSIAGGEAAARETARETARDAKVSVVSPSKAIRTTVGTPGGVMISADSVGAAASYANRIARDVLEQGMKSSLRSYRFAKVEAGT